MRLSEDELWLRLRAASAAVVLPLPGEGFFEAFVRHYFRLAGWRR